MAAKSGQMSQIELLLVYGGNLALLDSASKTAIDYAREAGHINIVNRLIEHQFDLTDNLTRYICLGRQPNHLHGEHFLIVDIKADCLNSSESTPANYEDRKVQNAFRNELHQSIQALSHKSFQELTRDIYDEIDRRDTNAFIASHYGKESAKGISSQLLLPFLPVYPFFSSTRNQGRQKLALLNTKEFTLLIVDVLNEIRRRIYGFNNSVDDFTNGSKYIDEFDEDDSEPLYDSVPSEGDYDECNELAPPLVANEGRISSATLVTSASSTSAPEKSYVSMNDYSLLKEQMLKSAQLMEQFFLENKEMRTEMQRLQGIVEKLVDENAHLRQAVPLPKHNFSNSSLNAELKSNSLLLDSAVDHLNRNSFLRGSGRVRPQSISYTNPSVPSNRYSNECISLKAPANVAISHSLSHSPSKSSNSSLLNFVPPSQLPPPPAPVGPVHPHPGVFVNSSNSSSSSLSSQPLPSAHPSSSHSTTQQQHLQMPYLAPSATDSHAMHFSGLNSHVPPLPTKPYLVPSVSPLPSKEDVIRKIEFITNSIKELLSNAREGKHDEYVLLPQWRSSSFSSSAYQILYFLDFPCAPRKYVIMFQK